MCRKTMDIKPKHHLKPDCLRRIVHPRLGLRLLRVVSVEQGGAGHGHWRSNIVKSTIRKYIHKEKKRAKLARTAKESEKIDEKLSKCEETSAVAFLTQSQRPRLPPPGAMAPENTTQYLMGKVYEDLQLRVTVPQRSEEFESSQEADTTLQSSYDACLYFQQQDFDAQYGSLW